MTAKDGTRIAVEVWLPANAMQGQQVPALLKGTPYWRQRELTPLGYAKAPGMAAGEPELEILNTRGYAVVAVDARGTGASFGTIKIIFSDAEISDYASVAEWITKQPWSSGNIGAYGFSYRGMTAANIASLSNASIKAVAPLFDLSDLYLLTHPGGAFAEYLMSQWGALTRMLNSGKPPCGGDQDCEKMVLGPKPVDGDTDRKLLHEAIAQHDANLNVYQCTLAAPARDDRICESGESLDDVSVTARKQQIERRNLPMFVVAGWFDESSPEQVLYRYKTFSNPQELVIGPFTHGGMEGDDPFLTDPPLDIPYEKQTEMMVDFFDRYLKGTGKNDPIEKSVQYYVLGAGKWQTSPVWPPAGSVTKKWFLGPSNGLNSSDSEGSGSVDRYKVDFSATTGTLSGYRGQVDLSKTDYGDRAEADSRLLAYNSSPMAKDVEIAGDAVAHLQLASSTTDGLVIVYLEDVSPEGRVTYITQGVLRLAFRKLASSDDSASSADPLHTYLRADMMPMTPGSMQNIVIGLSPIAALIRQGHRLRVAIAGADAGNLRRIPASGEVELTIARGEQSYIEVPYGAGSN